MWDYDKLFADGNIICTKDTVKGRLFIERIEKDSNTGYSLKTSYSNENLSCNIIIPDKRYGEYSTILEIQYIIKLDEHGNVIEKLFDREKDMQKPMPKLETGMFVKIAYTCDYITYLGYVNLEKGEIIYQDGGWDFIEKDFIVEIYSPLAKCFGGCNEKHLVWRDSKYQKYLNSLSKGLEQIKNN